MKGLKILQIIGLFEDQEFVDVTLACEGGKLIKAHKVVLSTSSTAFKHMFVNSRHTHQIVYLKGVKIDILEALIRFIYLGEVTVERADFDSFIALARELDVDGLDERVKIGNYSDFIDNNVGNVEDIILNATFYSRENQSSDYFKNEFVSVEEMQDESLASSSEINEFNEDKETIDLDNSSQVEPSVDQIISNPDINSPKDEAKSKDVTENKIDTSSFYQCDKCDFLTVYKVSLKKHILFRHEGITHPCTNCDSVFSCRASLKQHVKAKHEGIRFPCDLCVFKATSLSIVRKHKTKTHEKIN